MKPTDYIYTATGLVIDPSNVKHSDIRAEDIAYSLARIFRFNGHTDVSVAMHSIQVAYLLELRYGDDDLLYAHAILHDAAEAYLMDVPVPLKKFMNHEWIKATCNTNIAITDHFGVSALYDDEMLRLHQADKDVVSLEMEASNNAMIYPLECTTGLTKGERDALAGGYMAASVEEVEKEFLTHLQHIKTLKF